MSFLDYLADPFNQEALLQQAIEHITLVAAVMITAIVIGLTAGVVAHRVPWARPAILNTTSTFLTIPSFALFALMIPIVGIGFKPAYAALVLYALLPIVRNTVSGLQQIDPAIAESAKGMGMGAWGQLTKIELPNAWPVVMAGVRVSTLLIVGIAAIAALVGGPGLGGEIFRGIRSIGAPFALNSLLGGTLGIIVVALLFDVAFLLISRLTTSRGIRD